MKRASLVEAAAALLAAAITASSPAQGSVDEAGRYVGDFFPYAAFSRLPAERVEIGGRVLRVAFAPGALSLPRETILAWVASCADAVAHYFGALPAREAMLLIVPAAGRGVRGGTTYGYGGAASRILLGRDSTLEDLERDWVLVHELTHHAMPFLPREHHWMEEGLATYVEPIARAQRGQLRAESVWRDLVAGLPKGLPADGDRGLDGTPTWGRTYWGGASFYLLADIEIRRRTGNRKGLQHALRGIVAAGGNIAADWSVRQVLAAGDRATGTSVLMELYREMSDKPMPIDLERLWRELGVSLLAGEVRYDDEAPLAAIRRAITEPPSEAGGRGDG